MKIFKFALISIVALLVLIACSDGNAESSKDSTDKTPREVTSQEAQVLSTALSNNAADKNASFTITSGAIGSTGFVAKGKVDWINSIVEVEVSLFATNQVDIGSVSTKENVFESFLGMSSLANQASLEPKDWIVREFDPTKYGIDVLSQFIAKLAAPTPDNPILLKQNGAQFLGTESIDGDEVSKFQNTPNVTYFLTNKGEMKKVSAKVTGFPSIVEVVFFDRTTTTIQVPNLEQAHTLEDVVSFYPEKRPAF